MSAIHDQIKSTLEASGIAAKEIKVFGAQVMITALCQASADRWHMLLNNFCKKVRAQKTMIEIDHSVNAASKYQAGWIVWGTI